MKSKSVFEDLNVHRSNDIMTAFDNAIYNTACLVGDMGVYQSKKNKVHNNKGTFRYGNIVNQYENELVNEIENMFNPFQEINEVDNEEFNYRQDNGKGVYAKSNVYYGKEREKRGNSKNKFNKGNGSGNKFIHASKYVLGGNKGSGNYYGVNKGKSIKGNNYKYKSPLY
jgi:hypothetical protein